VSANTVSKACSTWAVGEAKICANGGAIAKSATLVTGYGAFATTGVPFLTPAGPVNSDNTSGHLRHVQYYPRVLADAEMQSLTTITDPSLFLNFMNPNTLDPRIAFTRASTATYTDVNGVLQTVNNDTPRWDYDPVTLALRGLLLEEARTNLIFPSGDVGDPLWLKSGVVVTAPVVTSNQTTAPDGTTTAARVVYPAVTGAGALSFFNKSTVVTAAVYTFSVWLRGNAGGEQLYLSAVAGSTWYSSPRITLTTQWRRYVLTTSTLSALGWAFCVGTDLRDTVGQTSTTGGTVFAWGMQLELGGFPTSFILTTGSTVTRAADSCVIPSANMTPWYSATAGSWQAEFDFIDATSAAPAGRIITQGALANTAALHMPGAPAFTVGQFDGAAAMNAVTTVSANTVTRAATTWAVGQAKVCTRGGPVASSASLTTGYGGYATNGVRFMTAVNPALSNYGHIRVIQYWPRVLPDAEMQQVTT
jgi:hypothetical protein